ncbi:MAG: rod shape-determining protein [Bryobacteraceae bacterium]
MVDIGGGTTDVAVISLSGIVYSLGALPERNG